VRAWAQTYKLPVLITNCSNNYGPRQFPEKLIPRMITCALAEQPLPVYGKGANVRDWIHVEDTPQVLVSAVQVTGEIFDVNPIAHVGAFAVDRQRLLGQCTSDHAGMSFSGIGAGRSCLSNW